MEDVRLRVTEKEVLEAMGCDSHYLQSFIAEDTTLKSLHKEFVENHPDQRGHRKVVNVRHVVERAGNALAYRDTRVLVATDLSKLTQVDLYVRFVASLVEHHLQPGGIWDQFSLRGSVDILCYKALMILRYLESRGSAPNPSLTPNELTPQGSISTRPTPTIFLSPTPEAESPPKLVTKKLSPVKLLPKSLPRKRKVPVSPEQEARQKSKNVPKVAGLFTRTFIPDVGTTPEPTGTREEQIEALKKKVAAQKSEQRSGEDLAKAVKLAKLLDDTKQAGKRRIAVLEKKIAEREFDSNLEKIEGREKKNVNQKSRPDFFKRTF